MISSIEIMVVVVWFRFRVLSFFISGRMIRLVMLVMVSGVRMLWLK